MRSLVVVSALLLLVRGPRPSVDALPLEPPDEDFDMETYNLNADVEWENLDVANVFGEDYDYDYVDQEDGNNDVTPETANTRPSAERPEVTVTPSPTPLTPDSTGPGLFGPETGLGMPTCILCVCIRGSVYCDDTGLDRIPPLPRDTARFYGRFNNIRHVKNTDFVHLKNLQSVDLTGNQISEMDDDVFRSLTKLQELLLADNDVQVLPELPLTLKHLDVRNNRLSSDGLHPEGFKDMNQLEFLYLSGNSLDYIPAPLPMSLKVLHLQNNNIQSVHEDTFCNRHDPNVVRRNLEDIRLDGNPLNVDLFVRAYLCLPRLPVGSR